MGAVIPEDVVMVQWENFGRNFKKKKNLFLESFSKNWGFEKSAAAEFCVLIVGKCFVAFPFSKWIYS